MVHVCHDIHEIVDPSTGTVDTLCVVGTLQSFRSHFQSWVLKDVLPVALDATAAAAAAAAAASGTVDDDGDQQPPAQKKSKTSSPSKSAGAGAASGTVEQARHLLSTVFQTLSGNMTPAKDTPTSTEVWVPRSSYLNQTEPVHIDDDAAAADDKDDNDAYQSSFSSSSSSSPPLLVVLILLPSTTTLSRHNCPGQASNITSTLKKHIRLTESTAVISLLERPEDARAVVSAVSRVSGGLLYNRKTTMISTTTTTDAAAGTDAGDDGFASQRNSHSSSHVGTHSRAVLRQPGPLVLSGGGGTFIHETALPSLNHVRVMLGHPTLVQMTVGMQQELATLALGIQLTRRLVDAPCSELNTTAFKEQALAICQDLSHALQANGAGTVTTKVIEGDDLDKQGFGGLYGVGKAAVHPPALVILSYTPSSLQDPNKTPSIVLVGKGIVFDTGGLQIKNKPGMLGMKRDMGGAAAILCAFGVAVRSHKPINRPLHAILCLAENAVATHATRADDILHMHSGKTVEINNTDAEGRVVLSDGCSAAIRHLNPGIIIDMATLTGAQGVATGKHFGALYCNDEKLEDIAVESGRLSGDLCHPMPYAPEFFKAEYASAVADMKNSVADRSNAQVSCAGQFIANHMGDWLERGGRWCHIDMAYPVYDKKDERATGYGVALLYSMIERLDGEE